jgi:hypothetical protein
VVAQIVVPDVGQPGTGHGPTHGPTPDRVTHRRITVPPLHEHAAGARTVGGDVSGEHFEHLGGNGDRPRRRSRLWRRPTVDL